MLIAYDSRTGNVARFIARLNRRAIPIAEGLQLQEPFVLVTYTSGFGQVPPKTASFLQQNSRWLQAVAASGNRNWGSSFARSADTIARQYGVPVLAKFELSGNQSDVTHFIEEVDSFALPGIKQSTDAAGRRRVLPAGQR